MKLSILKTTNPYYNLAVEEYLLKNSNEDYFLLWQNEPTVVIGKNQNAFTEVNLEFTKEQGIYIARRITGGGAVYHDLGNLNYSYISIRKGSDIDFYSFTKPIIDALAEMGISATLSGRNDIMIDDKKISGNAQTSHADRILHHGTLLFDSDIEILSSALKVDEEKIKARSIKSTKSRVTNIKPYLKSNYTVEDFISAIANHISEEYSASTVEIDDNEEISAIEQRNFSEEWLFPNRDFLSSYTFSSKKKFPFGIVSIFLKLKNDLITDAKIEGDFFQKKDITLLENALIGTSVSNIDSFTATHSISDYIFGMKNSDFKLLFEK